MISKISERAVDYCIRNGSITDEDQEIYVYGFFLIISHILFFLISATFGYLFGIPLESMLFYILFSAVRSYAGGFHALTESKCTVYTSIALFISVAWIWMCTEFEFLKISLGCIPISLTIIMFIAPLDSEAKKLTKREHSEYKKRSLILGIIITCAGIIMIRIKTSLFYVCVASLVLESILLVLGKKQTLSEN